MRPDVVDANAGAFRLYERIAALFLPKAGKYSYLRRSTGFSAVITVIKEIARSKIALLIYQPTYDAFYGNVLVVRLRCFDE